MLIETSLHAVLEFLSFISNEHIEMLGSGT